jgi:fructokinase
MNSHILVMGEALVDLVPGPKGREAVLGGSPYNVAIGLGRLGARVAIASSLSTDQDGQRFKAALEADGVDLSYMAFSDAQSPTALVEEGTAESGPRYIFTIAGTAFDTPPALPKNWPDDLRHIHAGSFSTLVPPMSGAVLEAMQQANSHRTTSYDPNIRPMITPDKAKARADVERLVALVDIVKASEEDMEWLYPDVAPRDAIQAWLKQGPTLAVLTRGGEGAEAFTASGHIAIPAPKITVQDTVGAGDSLMSSLLFAMDRDGALGKNHATWTQSAIEQWLAFAVRASAFTCTQKGSNPPRLKDLEGA